MTFKEVVVHSDFVEANLCAYYRAQEALCDVVIWCLGPLADETRDYGLLRCYLALATRRICRAVMPSAR